MMRKGTDDKKSPSLKINIFKIYKPRRKE